MFSKKLEYSFRIVTFLKASNERVSGLEIIEKLDIPKYYGLGILTKLVNSGLLLSEKGKNGGFYLTKSKISFLMLYIAIEEEQLMKFDVLRKIDKENIGEEIVYDDILGFLENKIKLEMSEIII